MGVYLKKQVLNKPNSVSIYYLVLFVGDTINLVTDTELIAQQPTVWRQIKNPCKYAARARPRTAAVWISPERWVFPDDRQRRRSTPPRARTTTIKVLDSREEFFGGRRQTGCVCVRCIRLPPPWFTRRPPRRLHRHHFLPATYLLIHPHTRT